MQSRLSLNSRDNLIAVFSFIPLFIVSAFRGNSVGTDTSNYIKGFRIIADKEISAALSEIRWEDGYVYLNKLVSLFTKNGQGIIIVTSFITLFGLFYVIKKYSKNVLFSIYLFIFFYYYFITFNLVRQYLAIGVLMFAYDQMIKRNFIKYVLLVLAAASFHQLAILLLPLYFLYGIRLNIKKLLIITLSFSLIIILIDKVMALGFELFPMYTMYFNTKYMQEGGMLTTVISGAVSLFALFIKLTSDTDEEYDFLMVLVLMSLLSSALSMKITLFNRLTYYFNIYYILFIPKALSLVKDVRLRSVYYMTIISTTFIYFNVRFLENWHRVVPYTLYINNYFR